MALFAQPPQGLVVDLLVPEQASELDFSIGLSPEVFLPAYGDGVTFKIILLEQGNKTEVFSKYIDPKNHPCDRRWFDERIDLGNWAGREVTLRFTTTGGPNKDTAHDWAYWGDIRLAAPSNQTTVSGEIKNSRYNLAYQDQDVLIYQNKSAYPRAFVIYDLINVSNFNQALDLLANSEIDLRHTAIVENFPADLIPVFEKSGKKISSGPVNVHRVTANSLIAEVKTDSPGLFVLSEQYYPGWRAYVDGREARIYAVDGILRGIFLKKGRHTVIFEYRPLSFLIGIFVSILSLLVTVTCFVRSCKRLPPLES
jgi:Bacterial membrane protein YfhO